jgi:1-phosphofructokinase
MIYTVTFNPAIDYIVEVDNLRYNMTNRSSFEQLLPGGKGLNVSTVLNNLGIENIALGFIAGFTGREIKKRFEASGGKCDFIELEDGISRINIKIKSTCETEINAPGPLIDNDAISKLTKKLNTLKNGDILVLSGSVPSPLSDYIYRDIIKIFSGKNIIIVVDAEKDLLLNTLPYKPFLIKPNKHELEDIFHTNLDTPDTVVHYAKKLQEQGARNVLVSMGGEGAALLTEAGNILKSSAPAGIVKNSVGAGDSMVAGFIAGWYDKQDYAHAFKMGISAGSASAFAQTLASKPEIEQIYNLF